MEWDLEEAIVYYGKQGAPRDQNALTALLREVQRENGGTIPRGMVSRIAGSLGIPESIPMALIRRIPGLNLSGVHVMEICTGPNCPRKGDLLTPAEKLAREYPEVFILKTVNCMRRCGKGPNIRWDGQLFSGADGDLLRRLVENAE